MAAFVVASWLLASALLVPAIALGASPVPTPEAGGDTRSVGEGPGLVGAPLLAVGGVVALGIVAAALTVLYVRATGGAKLTVRLPKTPPDDPGTGPSAGPAMPDDDSATS